MRRVGLLARSFATEAKKVELPKKIAGIHGRYAGALYTAAVKVRNSSLNFSEIFIKIAKG